MLRVKYFSLKLAVVVSLISLTACNPDYKDKDLRVAEATVLFADPQDYDVPDKMTYAPDSKDFLWDAFRPIGWSADGKFAYIIEPADQACGCYFFTMEIKDMDKNKVLWHWDFNDDGAGQDLDSVWNDNYKQFKEQLNNYRIVPENNWELHTEPQFVFDNETYSLFMETLTERDEEYQIDFVTKSSIQLSNPSEGGKSVIEIKHKVNDYILDANLPGYVFSPYEDRMAIIYKQEQMGYEGPPHVVRFAVYGTHLTDGF